MLPLEKILSRFDPATGEIPGAPTVKRHLSDLKNCFADVAAYDKTLKNGDPLLYSVSALEPAMVKAICISASDCCCREKSATNIL